MKKNDLRYLFDGRQMSKYKSHREFNFFGIKIKTKIANYESNEIKLLCLQIRRKLAMSDDICRINNTKFYVPNYPQDFIQSAIVDNGEFFEQNELLHIKEKYLPENDAVILDIGANIGNHSIYWAQYCNAKKIYSFEPIDTTFAILKKNIELNHLENKIIPFNIGLSDKECGGTITHYNLSDVGSTQIQKTESDSGIKLKKLDDMDIKEKIDFIKIDVEDHEYYTLQGMKNTLEKSKPIICIEIHQQNYKKIKTLLESYNYEQIEKLDAVNYIFKYKK